MPSSPIRNAEQGMIREQMRMVKPIRALDLAVWICPRCLVHSVALEGSADSGEASPAVEVVAVAAAADLDCRHGSLLLGSFDLCFACITRQSRVNVSLRQEVRRT